MCIRDSIKMAPKVVPLESKILPVCKIVFADVFNQELVEQGRKRAGSVSLTLEQASLVQNHAHVVVQLKHAERIHWIEFGVQISESVNLLVPREFAPKHPAGSPDDDALCVIADHHRETGDSIRDFLLPS